MGSRGRRSMPEAWLLLAVGLCILVAVAVDVVFVAGGQRAPSATAANAHYPLPAISGVFRLKDPIYGLLKVGGPCKGLGAYDGMLGGTPVVVKDQTGAPIANGALDIGKVADSSTCEFAFVVQDLPKGDAYQFEITGRSVGTYRYEDLTADGWQVTLSLG
jgi:hypothetical protein